MQSPTCHGVTLVTARGGASPIGRIAQSPISESSYGWASYGWQQRATGQDAPSLSGSSASEYSRRRPGARVSLSSPPVLHRVLWPFRRRAERLTIDMMRSEVWRRVGGRFRRAAGGIGLTLFAAVAAAASIGIVGLFDGLGADAVGVALWGVGVCVVIVAWGFAPTSMNFALVVAGVVAVSGALTAATTANIGLWLGLGTSFALMVAGLALRSRAIPTIAVPATLGFGIATLAPYLVADPGYRDVARRVAIQVAIAVAVVALPVTAAVVDRTTTQPSRGAPIDKGDRASHALRRVVAVALVGAVVAGVTGAIAAFAVRTPPPLPGAGEARDPGLHGQVSYLQDDRGGGSCAFVADLASGRRRRLRCGPIGELRWRANGRVTLSLSGPDGTRWHVFDPRSGELVKVDSGYDTSSVDPPTATVILASKHGRATTRSGSRSRIHVTAL